MGLISQSVDLVIVFKSFFGRDCSTSRQFKCIYQKTISLCIFNQNVNRFTVLVIESFYHHLAFGHLHRSIVYLEKKWVISQSVLQLHSTLSVRSSEQSSSWWLKQRLPVLPQTASEVYNQNRLNLQHRFVCFTIQGQQKICVFT